MTIGIDIDEVTANQMESLLTFFYRTTGTRLRASDFHTYNWWEVWGGTREEAIKVYYEFSESPYFEDMVPIKDAIDSINQIREKLQVYMITSRPLTHTKKTEDWLTKYFGENHPPVVYSSDFFSKNNKGKARTKVEICQELGIDTIVEDNGEYALNCAEAGIKAILFDRPWNQGAAHDHMVRVNGWKEAMPHF